MDKLFLAWGDECHRHHLLSILDAIKCYNNIYNHLAILKKQYCYNKTKSLTSVWHNSLLDVDLQVWLGKFLSLLWLCNLIALLQCNPGYDCNPTIQMWKCLHINQVLKYKVSKYLKLVELVIVVVLRSVEDKCMFFTFTFVGSKLRNQLIMHLDLIVKMYMQEFFKLDNFPFYIAIIQWSESEMKYSYVVEM